MGHIGQKFRLYLIGNFQLALFILYLIILNALRMHNLEGKDNGSDRKEFSLVCIAANHIGKQLNNTETD